MNGCSYQLNSNYYVAFDTLNERLREMSHGAHQWLAIPVPGIFLAPGEQPRSCALVGYSNPDGTALPNHLVYLFPAVAPWPAIRRATQNSLCNWNPVGCPRSPGACTGMRAD